MIKHYLIFSFIAFCVNLSAQITISGKVVNSDGEPLIQASVFLDRTPFATITDEYGKFMLENIEEGEYVLKASYVGYISYEEDIDLTTDITREIDLGENVIGIDQIQISSTRVAKDAAFAYTNLSKEEIEKENVGVDVPYLLRWTPSLVATSDAGNGIGYTGVRLRGSDVTAINVTLNGVPLNDAESQGVFWVNLPDFASSTSSVQIQRGVGTSTNGAGAFGGTISMNTNKIHQNAYTNINTSYGSFNSRKLSVNLGTGLMNDKFSIDGRYSIIKSDGYIDRATSDLSSWYISGTRFTDNSSLRFIAFSGKEETYQSWYGTPEAKVNGDAEELLAHYNRNFYSKADSINLFNSDRRYNYYTYENQVDDYQQDHYQLHYAVSPNDNLKLLATAHYTRGLGFFEEFKPDEDYSIYSFMEATPASGDLVRRRWLSNDFLGVILGSEYTPSDKFQLNVGGAVSNYWGDHYGNVIMAEGIDIVNLDRKYYEGVGKKFDANAYMKSTYKIGKLALFGDLQYRVIDYTIEGVDNDLTSLDVEADFSFFNPKFGLTYFFNDQSNAYVSYAVANREPKRSDFIDNLDNQPTHETLNDFELGYRLNTDRIRFEWNNYYMAYENQLVLTGNVNDVGAYIKRNVGSSYRVGTELSIATSFANKWFWAANSTISANKLDSFTEDLGGGVVNEYSNTNIAFSPSLILANTIMYMPKKGMEIELSTKYVGKQYLDNTSNEDRILPAYTYSNLRFGYDWDAPYIQGIQFNAIIYNLFNAKYSSNGYSYSYFFNETVTENFLYPQAGIHFMLGMNITL